MCCEKKQSHKDLSLQDLSYRQRLYITMFNTKIYEITLKTKELLKQIKKELSRIKLCD